MPERKLHVHFVHKRDDGTVVLDAVSYDDDFAYPMGAWVGHVYVGQGWHVEMFKLYSKDKGYEVSMYRDGDREHIKVWRCSNATCNWSYPEDDMWYVSRSFARKMTELYDF